MNNKIIVTIIVSLIIILLSGCIIEENVTGTYVHETGAFFTLNEDMTFYEKFGSGNTASGQYAIEAASGNLTMVYRPFGTFIIMEKTKTGYQNKYGGVYEKK